MKLLEHLLSLFTLWSKKASGLLTFSGQQSHFYISLTTCMNEVLYKIINKYEGSFFLSRPTSINCIVYCYRKCFSTFFFNLVFMTFRQNFEI